MLFLLTHFVTTFSLWECLNKASNISEKIIGQTKAHDKLPQIPSCSQEGVGELSSMRSAQHKISPEAVPSASWRNKQHRPVVNICLISVCCSYSCGYLGSLSTSCLCAFTSQPCRRQVNDFSELVIVYRKSAVRLLSPFHPQSSHQKSQIFF